MRKFELFASKALRFRVAQTYALLNDGTTRGLGSESLGLVFFLGGGEVRLLRVWDWAAPPGGAWGGGRGKRGSVGRNWHWAVGDAMWVSGGRC